VILSTNKVKIFDPEGKSLMPEPKPKKKKEEGEF
jgi:hypothetical protein